MAIYDMTATAQQAGVDLAAVEAEAKRRNPRTHIRVWGDTLLAQSRAEEGMAANIIADLAAKARREARAAQGIVQARWVRYDRVWAITGRGLVPGAEVDVVRASGEISTQRVAAILSDVDGVQVATVARADRGGYTDRYGDTHYRSRGYRMTADGAQIWDYA